MTILLQPSVLVFNTWSLLTTNCTRFATKDAVRIGNSFITIPITRHYNHSQLFLKPLRVYTITILHVCNYKHLLHSCTGWLLSYQLLSQSITHFPCLSPIETSLVGLLLTNSSRELLRHFSSAYKPSIVLVALLPVASGPSRRSSPGGLLRHRVYWCCLGNAAAQRVWRHRSCAEKPYSNAVAWRHRSCAEKTPHPLTAAQRVFCIELFSGRCLATLRCATPAAQPNSWWTCHTIK
jgi:hypothetical protein